MRLFSKEATSYAVLLVILFAIAAVAVWETLSYLEEHVPTEQFSTVAATVWALTLGFMFIAGAFGLWAIQFSAAAESRRRIGRLVDTMHYLSDGILAVDHRGRVTGSNPAVSTLLRLEVSGGERISTLFPQLTADDIALLLDRKTPNEVECQLRTGVAAETTSVRLRSQPSEDLTLILVSDVTSMNAQRSRARQVARLELIAHLARAVAYDFNRLLTVISGHAAILSHTQPGSNEAAGSIASIVRGAERGIALAGNILDLVQPAVTARPSIVVNEHVETAADLLRGSLDVGWTVRTDIRDSILPVPLPGAQMEQLILNLGHLVADASAGAGTLTLTVAPPAADGSLFDIGTGYAGVLLVRAGADGDLVQVSDLSAASRDSGVIQSVIASVLEEAGGKLDVLVARNGVPAYRVRLPLSEVQSSDREDTPLPPELLAYMASWRFLVAVSKHRSNAVLPARLNELGIEYERVDNVASALARIEEMKNLDVMLMDKQILGQESYGLLRAILKLRPSAGIVVMCEAPEREPAEIARDVVFAPLDASPDALLSLAIESKALATRRPHASAPRQ